MNKKWWTSENADSIRRERRALFDARHRPPSDKNLPSDGTIDQQHGRESPAFVPAAQQDLILLTLEILVRDPIQKVATSRREAFGDVYKQFVQVALSQAQSQAQLQARGNWHTPQVLPQLLLDTLAWIERQAAMSFDTIEHTLAPVLQNLQLRKVEIPAPSTPALHAAEPRVMPVQVHVATVQGSSPQPIEPVPSLPYSIAPSSVWRQSDAGGLGHSPV
ncbi:hypothetical protein H4582DRAFT_1941702 [Lactarius indigo]|nr:hypothetical protein H4582DRAFT_1941702 [Lactarius indigo]